MSHDLVVTAVGPDRAGIADALESLKRELREAGPTLGLTFELSVAPRADRRKGVPFCLKTYSMDQPGIVHAITSFLRERNINEELGDTLNCDVDLDPA